MGSSTSFFSQIFEKKNAIYITSHFTKLVSFFAKFIPSETLILPEILFCLVEIIFLLLYRNCEIKEFEKPVFNPKLV